MKVFWLNGGIQVQPESDVETEALLVLMQAIHYDRPTYVETPTLDVRFGDDNCTGEMLL